MAEDDKSSVFAKDQRYAIVPRDSVRLMAESAGFDELSDQVLDSLSEDISYRLREVIQQSSEFMRIAKRPKLTVDDFNDALRCSDCQPIFGHNGLDSVLFQPVKDADIFITEEQEVDLVNVALSSGSISKCEQPQVKARWLAIEGLETEASHNLAQPLTGMSALRPPVTATTAKPVSEELLLYYDHVTKAILGSDVELMKFALGNIGSNSNITPILPYLINFVANGVKSVSHDTTQLFRLLRTVHALVINPYLHLDPIPYLSTLIQTILFCKLELQTASINSLNDHWAIRDYSARLLSLTIRRWSSSMNRLKQTTENTLKDALKDKARPFCSHYGAIVGLKELGLLTVEDSLIPLLADYWRHLSTSLSPLTCRDSLIRSDAHSVRGALMMVALYIIRSHIALLLSNSDAPEPNSSNSTVKPADDFAAIGQQQQLSKERAMRDSTAVTSSFSSLYNFLYDCLGDSLACLLPVVRVPAEFYESRRVEKEVRLGDEIRDQEGDDLLSQFLSKTDGRGRGRRTTEGGRDSERSSRSSDEPMSGEDTDMTIKATVSDTSRGIKLTILKRPKVKPPSPDPQPLSLASVLSGGIKSPSKPPAPLDPKRERPSQGKAQLVDIFAWVPMRNRDVQFVFKFQGRIQLCMFSERQKAQNLARAIAAQHAAVSVYRSHCARLPLFSKYKKTSEKSRTVGARAAALDISIML